MDDSDRIAILSRLAVFYDAMLAEHGCTPAGVAWSDGVLQAMRFSVLAAGIDPARPLAVNDVGCGYGAMFGFLAARFDLESYVGTDICEAMIEAAGARIDDPRARFAQAAEPVAMADWSLASGIFGINPGIEGPRWGAVVTATLEAMARASRIGYAFNMLWPGASDDPLIHCAEPGPWLEWCRRHGRPELIEHPDLPDWTILVRR